MNNGIALLLPAIELATIQDNLLAFRTVCRYNNLTVTAHVTQVSAIEFDIDELGACTRLESYWHFGHNDHFGTLFSHDSHILAGESDIIAIRLLIRTCSHHDNIAGSRTAQRLAQCIRCAVVDIDDRCVHYPCCEQCYA